MYVWIRYYLVIFVVCQLEKRHINQSPLQYLFRSYFPSSPSALRMPCHSHLPYSRVSTVIQSRSVHQDWMCRPLCPCCGAACRTPSLAWRLPGSARGTDGWSSVWNPSKWWLYIYLKRTGLQRGCDSLCYAYDYSWRRVNATCFDLVWGLKSTYPTLNHIMQHSLDA